MTEIQMCAVDHITGGAPCLRVAQVVWYPEAHDPLFLCNFHAEPFEPITREMTGEGGGDAGS
jgi:hypothetical protein